jgi:uncharacterized protein
MPHGLGGLISIGVGFWALVVNWWPFTELLLGLIPFLFVIGGLIAIVAGVKMVVEERRTAQQNGEGLIPKQPFSKISEAFKSGSKKSIAPSNGDFEGNGATSDKAPSNGSSAGNGANGNGASKSDYRKFQIISRVEETRDVASFYLKPQDGEPLPTFLPGQYLTFKLRIPKQEKPVVRCYSLSAGNHDLENYRVTIKRVPAPEDNGELPPGLGSNYFHDHLNEGDLVEAKLPKGHFYLDMDQTSPVVLISGGVGVTPMVSMLESLVKSGSKREMWFIFGVQNREGHIMKDQLETLAKKNDNVHLKVFYSQPGPHDTQGYDFDFAERISINRLKNILPSIENDYYICAPSLMIDEVRKDLANWGVPKNQIHYEAFGQATVKKAATPKPKPDKPSITVNFALSNKTLKWKNSYDSILELAEANGIELESGCRTGSCGSCALTFTSGNVKYLEEPDFEYEEGECLACICIPNENLTIDA